LDAGDEPADVRLFVQRTLTILDMLRMSSDLTGWKVGISKAPEPIVHPRNWPYTN
jgi:hypothetical protein